MVQCTMSMLIMVAVAAAPSAMGFRMVASPLRPRARMVSVRMHAETGAGRLGASGIALPAVAVDVSGASAADSSKGGWLSGVSKFANDKKLIKKIVPQTLMMFCILFNYTILRDTKDVLVVTAPKVSMVEPLLPLSMTPLDLTRNLFLFHRTSPLTHCCDPTLTLCLSPSPSSLSLSHSLISLSLSPPSPSRARRSSRSSRLTCSFPAPSASPCSTATSGTFPTRLDEPRPELMSKHNAPVPTHTHL